MKDTTEVTGLPRRLAWFFGLWCAGVLTVTALGALLRAWLI